MTLYGWTRGSPHPPVWESSRKTPRWEDPTPSRCHLCILIIGGEGCRQRDGQLAIFYSPGWDEEEGHLDLGHQCDSVYVMRTRIFQPGKGWAFSYGGKEVGSK